MMNESTTTTTRQQLSLCVSLNQEDDIYGFLEDQVSLITAADKRLSLKFAFSNRLSVYLFGFEWFQRALGICLIALFLLASVDEPSNYLSLILVFALISIFETGWLGRRVVSSFYFYYYLMWNVLMLCISLAQALKNDQFVSDDARLIYVLQQISQHIFTFLWILLLCWSDALPHLSRRVKIGGLLLCEIHLLIRWIELRFGWTARGVPLQWCVASQYPGSCISANSIRISALVNIAAFLALQTVVLLQNYFSEEHSDPHFMIIMSRIRIDEELVNNVAVSDNTSTNTNIFDKVKSSLITPSPEEKSRDANIHPTASMDIPGSVVIRHSHRCSTVAFSNPKNSNSPVAVADSVHAEIDTCKENPTASNFTSDTKIIQTDVDEIYLGIYSDFARNCPKPKFASAPLFGARVQEMFLNHRALQVSACVSAFIAVTVFSMGITDSIRAAVFVCFLLYGLFWVAVSLDRNIIALLIHEFEYIYCASMCVVFLVAAVTQELFVSEALSKYRDIDYSTALFGQLAGDILWLISSLMFITYVTTHDPVSCLEIYKYTSADKRKL